MSSQPEITKDVDRFGCCRRGIGATIPPQNSHSKEVRNHNSMLGLWFAWYNFCRVHASIKTTPAVKAGLAAERWTLADLLVAASLLRQREIAIETE